MRLLCYNENLLTQFPISHFIRKSRQGLNGMDDVINHPDAIVIELDDNCDIHSLIEHIRYMSYTELEELFPMSNFKEVYWALFDNEFVDVID